MALVDITDDLVGIFKDPAILIGIPLALLGAVFMSFGAQYQHRGVQKVERLTATAGNTGLTGGQLLNLLRRPSWVVGTLMLGLAIVCQLSAMSFAPLILVQPIGAISLVITTLLNARISGHKPTARSITAIVLCVVGILIFVTIAALYAVDTAVTDQQLITVLIILAVVIVMLGGGWMWLRRRTSALFYIVSAESSTVSSRPSRRSSSAAFRQATSTGSRSRAPSHSSPAPPSGRTSSRRRTPRGRRTS